MEARDGLPLRPYAPAGSVLERAFRRMGLDRKQFSLTNTIRCRPRNNWLEGSPREYAALRHCRPNLDAAIAERRPRAILALGGIPTRELTGMAGDAQGVSHLCGYVLRGPSDVPVIPTFHPAFIRRGKASLQGVFARTIQRAVNVASGRDRNYLWGVDPSAKETHARLTYQTHPTLDAAEGFAQRVLACPSLTLSYDLETFESSSLDEDARDGFTDTHIRLIQFSLGADEGIAFPWEGRFRDIAARILRASNVKCGHNVWLFDNKVLAAAGAREGLDLRPRGVVRDTLQMFHHWQPDLPAHLQFAAQWVSFPFPWKHLAGSDLEFYGCCDVDATLRLHDFLEAALRRDGIWDGEVDGRQTLGYVGQVEQVRPVLAAMEDRGLPVDDAERLKLDGEFKLAGIELAQELMPRFPESAKKLDPYKTFPPELKKLPEEEWTRLFQEPDKIDKKTERVKAGKWYRYGQREVSEAVIDDTTGEPKLQKVTRWCYILEFNPNSGKQLVEYMKARGYKVPKSKETDDAGNEKDTTAKKELVRLANKTGDNFFLKTIEYRELSKMRGTYIEGFKPHGDGRAHPTFTFDSGTGQTTSRNPNAQNFPKHGRLAKAVRRMIAAPLGQIIVEADKKSYHVLTTGFEAEDADYMRMARLDMHSFVAGCFTGAWQPQVMEESDDLLLDRFRWFKADPDRKRIRDKQAKPTILGVGFGMGARRLYQENLEHFADERTAKRFLDLLQHLFPRVFEWQQRIRKLAHEQTFLRSRFGHLRRFYEVFMWDAAKGGWKNGDQAEEAVAFLPANHAFGGMREYFKSQLQLGLDEEFGLCNSVHDSFVYVFERARLDQFMERVVPVLRAPSKVLTHPTLAPDGLIVDIEVCAGPDWSAMAEIQLAKEATIGV